MATPVSPTSESEASVGMSDSELRYLWHKFSESSATESPCGESPLQSPVSTRSWSSPQRQPANAWVYGNDVAQDARHKLRAADEARWLQAAADAIDSHLSTPTMNASSFDRGGHATSGHAQPHNTGIYMSPDPVGHPHDYMEYMLEGSPISTPLAPSPAMPPQEGVPSMLRAMPASDGTTAPSPSLINDDVFHINTSLVSPQSEDFASSTDARASAAAFVSMEASRTIYNDPERDGAADAWDFYAKVPFEKRRAATLPIIRREDYSALETSPPSACHETAGDDRCLYRSESFTELVPAPQGSLQTSGNDALPALSSFRPIEMDSEYQPGPARISQKLSRALTAPVELAASEVPDEPAWMRPMHLVDTGSSSIYLHAHDNGPSRHALCLWCFRTHGDFFRMRKHGYESCGRTAVLKSHYWEDGAWADDSPDESTDDTTLSDL